MAQPTEGSKAKYLRDLLETSLTLRAPAVAPEEFERLFGIKVSSAEEIQDITFAEIMVRQLVLKACTGNDRSISEVLDRLLGKPMQTTETVSKSYSYHDFLIECRDSEEKTRPVKPAQIVEVVMQGKENEVAYREKPVRSPRKSAAPVADPLLDLL